uniref:Uncharacterized protein n=1 Tax=Calcidiscus leptoporus TaxID=127549 RepID=A0A7S0J7S5_9EUKA|mmetsp:Transcript_43230/g.101285  ORF Transcript_43230/g.101285 Transcript_43230/m.101285 type:complete len:139 (+) Transcript_43230:3-419(+)
MMERHLESAYDQLMSQGYAVIDGALPNHVTDTLRADMETLRQHGGLRQHRFGFKSDAGAQARVYTKPHIFEAELDDDAVQRLAPRLQATLDHLRLAQAARAAFPALRLNGEPGGVAVKLQCNDGSGCFPLHYDNAGSS